MTRDYFVLDDLPLEDETVIVRVDINSPVDPVSGRILSLERIKSHIKTVERLHNSKVVLIGHQSKPGKDDYISLKVHATNFGSLLNRHVEFVDDLIGTRAKVAIEKLESGDVLLLENVRFFAEEVALNKGSMEIQQNSHIVRNLAPMARYYVNDAFAAAHRAQPSLVGFTEKLPSAAGLVMEHELEVLTKVLSSDEHPCVGVLGGAKVGDSLEVAENMLKNKVTDKILTTGVVGNIFLIAQGHNLGSVNKKFLESEFKDLKDIVNKAKGLLKTYKNKILAPLDLAANKNGKRIPQYLENLPSDYLLYDIGLETIVKYSNIIKKAKNIIANGPAGVFEIEEFSFGTNEIFSAIANSSAFSIVGGGETIAVINKLGIEENIDHVSTGGGACINFLAGRKLPAVEALKNSKKIFKKSVK